MRKISKLGTSRSVEQLETRTMFRQSNAQHRKPAVSALQLQRQRQQPDQHHLGSAAGSDLYRGIVAANYGDGVSTPTGTNAQGVQTLPSTRLISNLLGNQTDDIFDNRNSQRSFTPGDSSSITIWI